MQRGGFGRSLLIGALIGLLLVAGVLGYLLWQGYEDSRTAGPDDVVLMLVLPDEEGVVLPRIVDRYKAADATVEHVDPRLRVEIPGTSYTQLRDAYTFEGPAGVVSAVAGSARVTPSYVVVDSGTFLRLMGDAPVTIEVPAHMEVFDGTRLLTFEQGSAEIVPADVTALFLGSQYLDAEERASVRDQVGEAMAARIAAMPDAGAWLETDLTPEEFATFVGTVGKAVRQ